MTYICVQICVYIYRIHVYIYTATYTHRESVLLLLLSHFSRVRLCVTPQTAAHQASCPWDSPGKNTGVGCHFLLQCMKVKSENEVAQSCPTASDPTDCSLPGSSIHGIFQARVLEWGAIAFSAGRVYIAENIQSIKDWTRLLHYNGKGTYTNSQKYWILILSEFFIGWVSIM